MPGKPTSVFLFLNDSGGLALGDAIVYLPFVRALKEWAPETEITISPRSGGVAALMPLFEPYISEAIDGIPAGGRRFDWAFDLVGESVSTAMAVRALAKRRFYSTAARGWLHLPRLPIYHGKNVINRRLGLLTQAIGPFTTKFWPWQLPEIYEKTAGQLLSGAGTYVGIAPGAGNAVQRKRWPLEGFVEIARRQADLGRTLVIFLGPQEAGWEEHFEGIPGCRFPLSENPGDVVPSDPTLTVALAGRLSAAVTNCCGAGHMLALGGARLVSIFGPTSYKKSAPFAKNNICVLPFKEGSREIGDVRANDVMAALEHFLVDDPSSVPLDPAVHKKMIRP